MPVTPTYPGVYIEEVPSGVRTIVGVATSITAFVGRARKGPLNLPVSINSYADFEREFGGLWRESSMSFAIRDFYLNGGAKALVVRLYKNGDAPAPDAGTPGVSGNNDAETPPDTGGGAGPADPEPPADPDDGDAEAPGTGGAGSTTDDEDDTGATTAVATPTASAEMSLTDGTDTVVTLQALSPGTWADKIRVRVDHDVVNDSASIYFNLTIRDMLTGAEERHAQVTLKSDAHRELTTILSQSSRLLVVKSVNDEEKRPRISTTDDTTNPWKDANSAKMTTAGSDGSALGTTEYTGSQSNKEGIYALEHADLFNLLCIPPAEPGQDTDSTVVAAAANYCEQRRAMLIVDPLSGWTNVTSAKSGLASVGTNSKNAAIFFPRLRQSNPQKGGVVESFVPCGAVAGVMARTDQERGVWKAPAGYEASLANVPELSVRLTDAENGELNPLGINCLRSMPPAGRVVWGARTLQGDDRLASDWKYIPVRRLALFIEESLYRGTHWVVFEPNDVQLWSQIRLSVGSFMHNLFRQGAFQGTASKEAYFVRCDATTTTQYDIDRGIVNIEVGFAPLKPAEFVIIKLQQISALAQV